MRRLLVAVAVAAASGCSLYFSAEDGDPPVFPVPDASPLPPLPIDAPWPDAPEETCRVIAFCGRDGTLYRTPCLTIAPESLPDDFERLGTAYAACPSGACQADPVIVVCPGGVCAGEEDALCRPPSTCQRIDGQPCTEEGAVSTCTELAGCAVSVVTDQCTCRDGTYACEPVCAGGLCGAPALAAAMEGRWIGTVTPPSFSAPYTGTLVFNPDRSYVADRSSTGALFYYGVDGAGPLRLWRPVGATATGGVATIDVRWVPGGVRTALITDIRRVGTRLSFTFWDSWLDCNRPFRFDLTAAP